VIDARARSDNFPRRFIDIDPPLVEGQGVPLETYVTIGMMKRLATMPQARFTRPLIVRLKLIVNVESVGQPGALEDGGLPECAGHLSRGKYKLDLHPDHKVRKGFDVDLYIEPATTPEPTP
jgi:hypothetical protein